MIEVLIYKTSQGFQLISFADNLHKYYIGYSLSKAKKQFRKDFNLKYKRIKFFSVYDVRW